MIPLTTIFEQIRKSQGYQKKLLATHLGVSVAVLSKYIVDRTIPNVKLEPWAKFLDFGEQDLIYLRQYNNRQKIYHKLPDPTKIERNNTATLLLFFWDDLPIESQQRIQATVHKEVLPYMTIQSSRITDAVSQICQTKQNSSPITN
jgi:hypothetical protein